jgi:recA bacterial DNA recombination protein
VSHPPAKLAALRTLLAARFPEKGRGRAGGVPTGIAAVDEALGGGLPAGRLTELVSAEPGCGAQAVLVRLLCTTRAGRQRVALVDAADGFAPEAVPADALRHLVWVRSPTTEAALAAADLLVRDGNYAVVILDLRGVPARTLRRAAAAGWYRLQRAAEAGTGAVLVQTPCRLVPAAAARLILHRSRRLADAGLPRDALAARIEVEAERRRGAAGAEQAG